MMSNRLRHSGLWFLAGLCLLAAFATATTAWLRPVSVTGQPTLQKISPVQSQSQTTEKQTTSNLPSLASYQPIWKLQLRPVIKTVAPPPPPKAQTPPPPRAKPFTAKLTGTILEPKHSMALFTTKTGEITFVGIGQMIEDAKVIQIQPKQVILEHNGQTLTLELSEVNTPANHRRAPSRANVINRRRPIR